MNLARLLAVTLLTGTAYAAAPPISLTWGELSSAIANEHIIVDLNDGSRVKAVGMSVQELALAVNVSSNSHPTYKKGQVAIPREAIAGLRLIRMHKRGRIIFTSVGAILGLGVAATGISADRLSNGRGTELGLSVMAVLTAAGYFIGTWTDRQEIRIAIRPD